MTVLQDIQAYFEKGESLEANKTLLLEDLLKRAETELKRLNNRVNKFELRAVEAANDAKDRMDYLNEMA